MSHIKNVEAFEKLVGLCAGYGEKYNPAQENLQVQKSVVMLTASRNVLQETGLAKTNYEKATNTREVAYTSLNQLAIRVLGELMSSNVINQTVNDAKFLLRKINGIPTRSRLSIPSGIAHAAGEGTFESNKMSRRVAKGLDFGTRAQNFEKMIQTLVAEQAYRPNISDLKVDSLSSHLQKLRALNLHVVESYSSLSEARKKRNAMFYKESSNLFSTAQAMKEQVKATFGTKSEAFHEVRKITFTKPIK